MTCTAPYHRIAADVPQSDGAITGARTTVDVMVRGTDGAGPGRSFDPEQLVLAVDECFDGFGFTIQTFRPEIPYAERLRAWFADKEAAESRGRSFDDPPPPRNFVGSAAFDHCVGEERDSGFVLELSMNAESGRPFTLFIEEDQMFPEDGHQGPNIEPSIAAQLAFWTAEMICHGTVEDLDGRAVGSGKWMKAWS